jgi:hypothetical protein
MVRLTHQPIEDGFLNPIKTTATLKLSDKLDEYILRLGQSSAHMLGVIIHLMVQAKVHVDFRDYVERLELVDPEDRLSSAQAISLFDDYLVETNRKQAVHFGAASTQRIIIHRPTR